MEERRGFSVEGAGTESSSARRRRRSLGVGALFRTLEALDRSWRARVWERVGCGYDDLILMGDAVV